MNPLASLLRTLYPAACVACDRALATPSALCPTCSESLEPIENGCSSCARPMPKPLLAPCSVPQPPQRCALCLRGNSLLTSCTACFEYGGQLAVALRRLKFSGRSDIAKSLRPILHERFSALSKLSDVAVAVPLHQHRHRKRGFNQSMRLLAALAQHNPLPVNRRALTRTRATPAQSTLSRSKRIANLRGAFTVHGDLQGARVLLLDDIRTTGATLEEAARSLRSAGAREIHGFVVARTEWEG